MDYGDTRCLKLHLTPSPISVAFARRHNRNVPVLWSRVRGTYFHHPMHDEALEFIDDLIGLIVQERNPKASSHAGNGS